MIRRVIVAGATVIAATGVLAAPAAAHVTIDPSSAPKGGTAQLAFIVPNESATARTNKVQIYFPPAPDAIAAVSVEAVEGWHFAIRKQRLPSPIVTDDGSISEVVSAITWVANNVSTAIGPDEFVAFSINADGLPEDADEVAFRVVQSYTDGTSVRWVDPVSETGPEAPHPTPILALTDGTNSADGGATATATTQPVTEAEPDAPSGITTISAQDDNARALAVIGIVVGGVALVAATGALMRRRRAR
jgi:uncharacterized protein YcnI